MLNEPRGGNEVRLKMNYPLDKVSLESEPWCWRSVAKYTTNKPDYVHFICALEQPNLNKVLYKILLLLLLLSLLLLDSTKYFTNNFKLTYEMSEHCIYCQKLHNKPSLKLNQQSFNSYLLTMYRDVWTTLSVLALTRWLWCVATTRHRGFTIRILVEVDISRI